MGHDTSSQSHHQKPLSSAQQQSPMAPAPSPAVAPTLFQVGYLAAAHGSMTPYLCTAAATAVVAFAVQRTHRQRLRRDIMTFSAALNRRRGGAPPSAATLVGLTASGGERRQPSRSRSPSATREPRSRSPAAAMGRRDGGDEEAPAAVADAAPPPHEQAGAADWAGGLGGLSAMAAGTMEAFGYAGQAVQAMASATIDRAFHEVSRFTTGGASGADAPGPSDAAETHFEATPSVMEAAMAAGDEPAMAPAPPVGAAAEAMRVEVATRRPSPSRPRQAAEQSRDSPRVFQTRARARSGSQAEVAGISLSAAGRTLEQLDLPEVPAVPILDVGAGFHSEHHRTAAPEQSSARGPALPARPAPSGAGRQAQVTSAADEGRGVPAGGCAGAGGDAQGASRGPEAAPVSASRGSVATRTFKKEIGPESVLAAVDAAEVAVEVREQVVSMAASAGVAALTAVAQVSRALGAGAPALGGGSPGTPPAGAGALPAPRATEAWAADGLPVVPVAMSPKAVDMAPSAARPPEAARKAQVHLALEVAPVELLDPMPLAEVSAPAAQSPEAAPAAPPAPPRLPPFVAAADEPAAADVLVRLGMGRADDDDDDRSSAGGADLVQDPRGQPADPTTPLVDLTGLLEATLHPARALVGRSVFAADALSAARAPAAVALASSPPTVTRAALATSAMALAAPVHEGGAAGSYGGVPATYVASEALPRRIARRPRAMAAPQPPRASSVPPHFGRLQAAVERARAVALEATDRLLQRLDAPVPPLGAPRGGAAAAPRFVAVEVPPQEADARAELAASHAARAPAAAVPPADSASRALARVLASGPDAPGGAAAQEPTTPPVSTQTLSRSPVWETPRTFLVDSPLAFGVGGTPTKAASSTGTLGASTLLAADGLPNVRFLPMLRARPDIDAMTDVRTAPAPPPTPLFGCVDGPLLPDSADSADALRPLPAAVPMTPPSSHQRTDDGGRDGLPGVADRDGPAAGQLLRPSALATSPQRTGKARFMFKREMGPDVVLRAMDAAELAMDTRDQVASAVEAASLSVRAAAAEASAALAGALAFRASLAAPAAPAFLEERRSPEHKIVAVDKHARAGAASPPLVFDKGDGSPGGRTGGRSRAQTALNRSDPSSVSSWKSGVDAWFASIEQQRQAASESMSALIDRPSTPMLDALSSGRLSPPPVSLSVAGGECHTPIRPLAVRPAAQPVPSANSPPVSPSGASDSSSPLSPLKHPRPQTGGRLRWASGPGRPDVGIGRGQLAARKPRTVLAGGRLAGSRAGPGTTPTHARDGACLWEDADAMPVYTARARDSGAAETS